MTENVQLTPEEHRKLSPFWRARPMHQLRLKTLEANGGDK